MIIPGQLITAIDMANANGIDPKRFRAALRAVGLGWHPHNGRWEAMRGSDQHQDMETVMAQICGGGFKQPLATKAPRAVPKAALRDEHYVLDLCDEFLGLKAVRQHCFPFLTGDPDRRGRRKALPVDGFYPSLNLVVEYHERQHRERVGFFDDMSASIASVSAFSMTSRRSREYLVVSSAGDMTSGVAIYCRDTVTRSWCSR